MRRRQPLEAEKIPGGAPRRRYLRRRLMGVRKGCRSPRAMALKEVEMDATPNEVRKLNFDNYSTSKHLEHAAQPGARSANIRISSSSMSTRIITRASPTREIFQYIESPVIRRARARTAGRGGRSGLLDIPGRLSGYRRPHHPSLAAQIREDAGRRRIATSSLTKRWMDAMGVDYACLFPTPMLYLGLHPQVEIEVALARAYNRWLCEHILAAGAAHRLDALPAVQRSRSRLQDGEGFRRQARASSASW